MMNMQQQLEHYSALCASYFSLNELFTWENRQVLPPKGAAYRQRMTQHFSNLEHAHKTGPAAGDLLIALDENPPCNPTHQAMHRDLRRNLIFMGVPPELLTERQRIISAATLAWEEANQANDAQLWLPLVQEMMDNSREIALCVQPGAHPYEFWHSQYEINLPLAQMEPLFARLKDELLPIIQAASERNLDQQGDRAWEMHHLLPFCKKLAAAAGFNDRIGRWGETRLPFSSIIGPRDVRIAVNFSTPRQAFMGTMHEVGHAVYAAGADESLHYNGLWVPFVGGYDEAMAILWERMIGQSFEFWSYFYPLLQSEIGAYTHLPLDEFLAEFRCIRPTPIRAGADEVTYPLHILIRCELEKAFLEGSLRVADLPKAWQECYQRYLGVHPPDDRSGCLQDVHWSLGLIGYFPSYLLGSLLAAQIFYTIPTASVLKPMASGDFSPLREWLKENCYRHGRIFTPRQLLQNVTGKDLEVGDFLSYIRGKYNGGNHAL